MADSVRYMGNKRQQAPGIAALISEHHPGAVVADAFAGTCAVASEAAPRHVVLTNDLHQFAVAIARSLFCGNADKPAIGVVRPSLEAAFIENRDQLVQAAGDGVDEEDELLGSDEWKGFRSFNRRLRRFGQPLVGLPGIEAHRAAPGTAPYSLFTRLYPGTYFGLRQAIELDSLRYAIAEAEREHRDALMNALLVAASHCAAAPGHFAQPLTPRDAKNTRYIMGIRRRSLWDRFIEALDELVIPSCHDRASNGTYNLDAIRFVQTIGAEHDDLVVYADPPFSRAQYSRYYHVLETLALYDYPVVEYNGRYRPDRFQTGFSQRAKVSATMESFIESCAATGAKLFLSYPRRGLLQQAHRNLLAMLRRHYAHARVITSTELDHSTFGASNGEARQPVTEDVYYAHA